MFFLKYLFRSQLLLSCLYKKLAALLPPPPPSPRCQPSPSRPPTEDPRNMKTQQENKDAAHAHFSRISKTFFWFFPSSCFLPFFPLSSPAVKKQRKKVVLTRRRRRPPSLESTNVRTLKRNKWNNCNWKRKIVRRNTHVHFNLRQIEMGMPKLETWAFWGARDPNKVGVSEGRGRAASRRLRPRWGRCQLPSLPPRSEAARDLLRRQGKKGPDRVEDAPYRIRFERKSS